jgi:hypothetical protein
LTNSDRRDENLKPKNEVRQPENELGDTFTQQEEPDTRSAHMGGKAKLLSGKERPTTPWCASRQTR